MDILMGYAGLTIAFVILAVMLLLVFIRSNVNIWIKLGLSAAVLFYSCALYFAPGNFMGWPTDRFEHVTEVIILDVKVDEPISDDEEGYIFLWVMDYNLENVRSLYKPRTTFMPYNDKAPRSFVIVYNSDVHEQLIENITQQQENGGMLTGHMDRLRGVTNLGQKNNIFELVDPRELLKKEE